MSIFNKKGESRCIPYTPTTYGPSPVFGGGPPGAAQPPQTNPANPTQNGAGPNQPGTVDQAAYAALGYGYQTGASPIAATGKFFDSLKSILIFVSQAHHPAYTTTATPYTLQQNAFATTAPPGAHMTAAHAGLGGHGGNPHEPPTLMGPLGPINPVELLAETDTAFFKNQLNKQKLPDGQTEFHIPKEMVVLKLKRFLNSITKFRWDQ